MGMLPHWVRECEMERDGGRVVFFFFKFCYMLRMNVPLASFKQLREHLKLFFSAFLTSIFCFF